MKNRKHVYPLLVLSAVVFLLVLGFLALRFYVQMQAREIAVARLQDSGAIITFHEPSLSRILSGGMSAKTIRFDYSDSAPTKVSPLLLAHIRAFPELKSIDFINCELSAEALKHVSAVEIVKLSDCFVSVEDLDAFIEENPNIEIRSEDEQE